MPGKAIAKCFQAEYIADEKNLGLIVEKHLQVYLKAGREESLLRRHPWIFSGAVSRTEGEAALGETVKVVAADGRVLGHGAWSPHSQIRVRMWTFDEETQVDAELVRSRCRKAADLRAPLAEKGNTAFRLINSESDGLPGVIVDRYDRTLVCQFLSAGAEFWRETIVGAFAAGGEWQCIYERSDVKVRQQEGLPMHSGRLWGEEPPELIKVTQNGLKLYVDIRRGHKTGLYLDQRENYNAATDYCREAEVLNAFSYSGGFGLHALNAGARSVLNLDSSQTALDLCRRNAVENGFAPERMQTLRGDVFQLLRRLREENRLFDVVILDPPKFAESNRQVQQASRGYKDINMLAMQLLRPNGVLLTFSCSGHVSPALFQKIVADAALDAGRDAQILRVLGQASDHPVLLSFPEGAYLKGLVCRIL